MFRMKSLSALVGTIVKSTSKKNTARISTLLQNPAPLVVVPRPQFSRSMTTLPPANPGWQFQISDCDLSMVGGNHALIEKLGDVVRFIQTPKSFAKLGAKIPKGIMLSGPPGVGKTMLASAIAGHAGVKILTVSGSEFICPLIGQAEEKIRELFATARAAAPCVLCIDEIDSIGQKRFSSPRGSADQSANAVVNQLLLLLSENNDGVIIIATTNNYATLDPALVRPGRFDRHIVVPLPDLSSREQILKLQITGKKLSSHIHLKELAQQSAGFSGAKLAAWVNEAAICAAREDAEEISSEHFDEAYAFIENGVQHPLNTDAESKKITAIHEAGHALVAYLLQRTVSKVSVLGRGNNLGYMQMLPRDSSQNLSKQQMLDRICISLAGRAAELNANVVQVGSSSDLSVAKSLAHHMLQIEGMGSTLTNLKAENEIEALLAREMSRAQTLLSGNSKKLELIIKALMEHHEIGQADFLKVVNGEKIHPLNASLKKVLPLPPKSPRPALLPSSSPMTQPLASEFLATHGLLSQSIIPKSLPFTLDEVAKTIEVSPKVIRMIKQDKENRGFVIIFKPSFNDDKKMQTVSDNLKNHDIENCYMKGQNVAGAQLYIFKEGYMEFLAYLRHMNASAPGPARRR